MVVGVVAAMLFLVFGFQNCTQYPEGDGDMFSKESKDMPFVIDSTVDQIAYMSCPRMATTEGPIDNDMYFSFRVGAYRFGGMKLTDQFYTTNAKRTPERLADLLVHSPANSNTVLQLAVRSVANLNSLVTGGTSKPGMDYQNMLAPLKANEVYKNIIDSGFSTRTMKPTGKRVKYLRNGTGYGARMEGSLNFGLSESLQDAVRTQFLGAGKAMLTLTYLEPSAPTGGSTDNQAADTNVRNPGTVFPEEKNNQGLAYGVGFDVRFNQPPGGARGRIKINPVTQTASEDIPYPSNILTQVQERNLLTGASGGVNQWVCPDPLRFRIIRFGDANDPIHGCKRGPDKNLATNFELQIARNVFKVEDWFIDMENHCLIPKRPGGTNNSCYGEVDKVAYVQYDYTSSAGCDPHSTGDSNGLNSKICLAWATVCYKTTP